MPRQRNPRSAPRSPPLAKKARGKKQNTQAIQERPFAVDKSYNIPQRKPLKVKNTPGLTLSKCALKYALAVSEPFHPDARGACLPVYPSCNTQKVTSFSRVIVTIGTNGFGFINIIPTMANDAVLAFYSSSNFAGVSANPLSANDTLATGVGVLTGYNIPYNTSSMAVSLGNNGQNVAGRIVSVGSKISYTGTTLNESGVYYGYAPASHENVAILADTFAKAGNLADAQICNITRTPCSLTLTTATPTECEFSNMNNQVSGPIALQPFACNSVAQNPAGQFYTVNALKSGSPSMNYLFSGVAGSSFLVEIVQHIEYIGPNVAGQLTPSDADQKGFEIVQAANALLPQMKMSFSNSTKTNLQLMREAIGTIMTHLKPIAIDALVGLGTALLL